MNSYTSVIPSAFSTLLGLVAPTLANSSSNIAISSHCGESSSRYSGLVGGMDAGRGDGKPWNRAVATEGSAPTTQ